MNQEQALAYLADISSPRTRIADVYDEDAELREALDALMPGFEYPDISYLTLDELHRRCSQGQASLT